MNVTDIKIIGVIGAGQMGSAIAQVSAASGFRTLLADVGLDLALRAKQRMGAILQKQVDKGKLSVSAREETLGRVEPVGGMQGLADADFVIEAATENVELKLAILRDADARVKKTAIVASNTPSLSITRLAGAVTRPSQLIGLHFLNPVPGVSLAAVI